jgi:hypothetical protein
MSYDFTYQWRAQLAGNKSELRFGKLLQFVPYGGDIFGMMLRTDGRVEQVRYNFLQAIGEETAIALKTIDRAMLERVKMKKYVSVVLCFSLAVLSVSSGYGAAVKEAGVMTPMKYEGGSLPLDQHDKLKTYVGKDDVVLVQGNARYVIPVDSITEVSYGNDVHRRVGLAAGVAVLTLGVGALLLLVKTKKHYVGIVWEDKYTAATSTATAKKGGVVFKVGKGDYRGFMAALEGVAGIKVVSADAVGSGGTSK